MSISEEEILRLLEEHTTFAPHQIDGSLRVSKWGSIVETRRFLDFAKAVVKVANQNTSDKDKLISLLETYKVQYATYGSKKKQFVVPKGHVRKALLDKGQRHEFIFDGVGKFMKYHVLKA